MVNIFTTLQGKKTYLLNSAAIIYAITGLITGHLSQTDALAIVAIALQNIFHRDAIAKVQQTLQSPS